MLDGLTFLHYLHNFLLNNRSASGLKFVFSLKVRGPRPLGNLSNAQARGL
jgi:hypothetical protein